MEKAFPSPIKQKPIALNRSEELSYNLNEIISVDDKVAVENIPDLEIRNEAKYVLDKFLGDGGFEQADDYNGNNGPELQKWAKKEVATLRKFLAKYSEDGSSIPKAVKIKPSAGMKVTYRDVLYELTSPAGPRRGWIVKRVSDGKVLRLKAKQVTSLTLV